MTQYTDETTTTGLPFWSRHAFAIALAASSGFLAIYVWLGTQGWGLPAAKESPPGELSRWCERVSDGIFREPANALSNLGFMVAGLTMVWVLTRDRPGAVPGSVLHGTRPIALFYAAAAIFLGPGSMLMHGTHTAWGGWADNLSMVMYISLPWLINVAEMGRWSTGRLLTTYLSIVVLYGLGRIYFGSRLGINLNLFGVSLGLWGISEVLYRFWSPRMRWLSGFIGFAISAAFGQMPWDLLAEPAKNWWVVLFWLPGLLATRAPLNRRRYNPWCGLGVLSFALAFAIWTTGRPTNALCRPDSWIQAHAIWHLLTALATWCFFMFLRTQRPLVEPRP